MIEATKPIYTNSEGKTITWEDLQHATGRVDYESIGTDNVTDEIRKLHRDGRKASKEGNYQEAVSLLEKAHQQAPQWPYPPYDLAHAHLLLKQWDTALEYYNVAEKLAPQGFFLAKQARHYLALALEGAFPPGLLLAYFRIEWHRVTEEQLNLATQITEQYPKFAPAWARLAHLQTDAKVRLASIQQGLDANPDAETRGNLLINKAMILHYSRKTPQAIEILGDLYLGNDSTLATQAMSQMALAALMR